MMQSISSSIHVAFIETDNELTCNNPKEKSQVIKRHQRGHNNSHDGNTTKSIHEMAVCVATQAIRTFIETLPESLKNDIANRDIMAPFKKCEVKLGRLLGSGEFSDVFEIKSFSPDASMDTCSSKAETETRQLMKACEQYRDSKKARYAMKQLRSELSTCDPHTYSKYASDIVIEAELLSYLQHPNIIKVRGVTMQGPAGLIDGPKGYFLIIDKLDETLDSRIKSWKKRSLKKKSSFELLQGSMTSVMNKKKTVEDIYEYEPSLLPQQLDIALQIAAAMRYLHEKRIIFRDLKPENLGFDVRGDIKLFDFGLAKVMPSRIDPYVDAYKMSIAGTPRYMSAEVLSGEAGYNLKADVYTYGIVLWELLSLEKPFVLIRNKHALIRHVGKCDEIAPFMNYYPYSLYVRSNHFFFQSAKEAVRILRMNGRHP